MAGRVRVQPSPPDAQYASTPYAKYGWVCEHDPYDPRVTPRKHTALGRFRHENTAFRARARLAVSSCVTSATPMRPTDGQ